MKNTKKQFTRNADGYRAGFRCLGKASKVLK